VKKYPEKNKLFSYLTGSKKKENFHIIYENEGKEKEIAE
jgi:hypothetical protein